MEKEKLIELSKQYFDNNKDLNEIFASSDGNFFYKESYVDYHVARCKLIKHKITRIEAYPVIVEKPVEVKEVVREAEEPYKQPVKKVNKTKKTPIKYKEPSIFSQLFFYRFL